jgi:hypothetical protein
VLRQVKPGLWRYSIDTFANPELASKFNGDVFPDRELPGFAERARKYAPRVLDEQIHTLEAFPRAEDVVAELEARFLAEQARLEEAATAAAHSEKEAPTPDPEGSGSDAEHDEESGKHEE